jgi:glc operon protein GlcG
MVGWEKNRMQNRISLDHEEAQKVIQTIQAELHRRKKAAVIAVAGEDGELIALLRLDGAPLASIVIASNKAWTAARERKPTLEIGQAARDPKAGFDMAYYGDPRYIGWGGGIPVVMEAQVIGAIAVSGLSEQEDIELAAIGLAALMS